ncbi:MAG: plastocyanin/azurin family copper-binding protein [Gaiellaceae bacterium]
MTGLAVVGTALAGYSFAGVTTPATRADVTQVTVHAGEYYFILSQNSVPVGTVVFNIINDGDVTHDFSIAGQTSATISSHDTTTLTVTFTNPGNYPYLCTIGEHAIYGMQGLLTVTGSAVTTTTKATTTTTTPPPPPPPAPQVVAVSEKEFSITLQQGTKNVTWVKPGDVHFMVKNVGKIPHNFVIAGQQTLVLSPGKSQELDLTLAAGRYPYLCSITGHAALGMKGTLIVSNTPPKTVQQTKTTIDTVTMREFKFTLSKRAVPHGAVIFKLINRGKLSHDFKIAGHKSALVKPGKTATLRVTISKKGKYAYLCTVPGHAKAGMKGTLTVT